MQDEQVTLETPEHIELQLELAGIGSRFTAGFLDSLLQALVIIGLGIAAGYSRLLVTGDEAKVPIYIAIAIFSSMLIIIAYYTVFELAWGGQSPGKRAAGLVVVRDDGGPIGFNESAVRNILRLIDILPIYYTIGMISIFFTKRCKRLGDVAAGTIVIKVRDFTPPETPTEAAEQPASEPEAPAAIDPLVARAQTHIAALSPREADTIERFIDRRMELEQDSRRAVAARIADSLRDRFPGLSREELPDPEVFLEIIHQARLAARKTMNAER